MFQVWGEIRTEHVCKLKHNQFLLVKDQEEEEEVQLVEIVGEMLELGIGSCWF